MPTHRSPTAPHPPVALFLAPTARLRPRRSHPADANRGVRLPRHVRHGERRARQGDGGGRARRARRGGRPQRGRPNRGDGLAWGEPSRPGGARRQGHHQQHRCWALSLRHVPALRFYVAGGTTEFYFFIVYRCLAYVSMDTSPTSGPPVSDAVQDFLFVLWEEWETVTFYWSASSSSPFESRSENAMMPAIHHGIGEETLVLHVCDCCMTLLDAL